MRSLLRSEARQELEVLEDDTHVAAQLRDARRLQGVRRDSVHPDLAGGGADLAVDQLQKGGLAGAAGAYQERQLTRLQGQVDVIERKTRSIRSSHRGELENRAQYVFANGKPASSLNLRS